MRGRTSVGDRRRIPFSARASSGAIVGLSVILGACQTVGAPLGPVAAPAIPQGGMGCEQAQAFAFTGETSLAAIGLGNDFGGPEAQRIGKVWVTADAIDMFGPGGRPPGVGDEAQRMVCVEWPDGSGMAGPLPAGWEPPAAFNLDAQSDQFNPPLVLIGLVAAAGLIVGVSFLAFRGERQ